MFYSAPVVTADCLVVDSGHAGEFKVSSLKLGKKVGRGKHEVGSREWEERKLAVAVCRKDGRPETEVEKK